MTDNPGRRFLFILARDIGCTVAELAYRLSCSELTEWMALYALEAKEQDETYQKQKDKNKKWQ